ncbi:hypothetical protein [Solidesulfovibrio sp. C21]|uniref:hypothetical protein n=1 Tax=Solidesulfovibrio sp. C21 TaxID=3398613 RepID=UPI0039FD536E
MRESLEAARKRGEKAAASQEQSAATDAIENSIADVNRVSGETAQAMERATMTVTGLGEQTRILQSLIDELRGSGQAALPV